jgi:hypothetical protein
MRWDFGSCGEMVRCAAVHGGSGACLIPDSALRDVPAGLHQVFRRTYKATRRVVRTRTSSFANAETAVICLSSAPSTLATMPCLKVGSASAEFDWRPNACRASGSGMSPSTCRADSQLAQPRTSIPRKRSSRRHGKPSKLGLRRSNSRRPTGR